MPIHTIHHYEDQPEMLRWIPSTLLNQFWMQHPEWIQGEGYFTDGQELTTFKLFVDGEEHLIEFRRYQNLQYFNDEFPKNAKPGDIALVDLMENGTDPRGMEAYRWIVEALGSDDAVYLLTAFPKEVTISVPAGHILSKPVHAVTLANLLIAKLAIGKKP
jgi:hypothetical protein